MQEAGTTNCPADIEREAQACVSSKLRQTREVCVWIPKREAQQACVSETSLPKRNVQQREGYASSQRHETRVSTTKRGIEKVRVSQSSLTKRDNQQRKFRVSAHLQSQNARAAPVLHSVSSAFLKPASQILDVRVALRS